MHLGFITTVRGYQWAGSEELWYSTALLALQRGHQVSALVNAEMEQALPLQHLSQQGGNVIVKKTLPHPRLEKFREQFLSSYRQFSGQVDSLIVSLGSLLDPVFTSGLIHSLTSSNIPYILLCQFNAESLVFSPTHRAWIQNLFRASAGSIFVSEHNRALAQRQLASPLTNSTVIYNPIRFTSDHPLTWSDKTPIQLACVARMETLWKGHDVLLQVLGEKRWKDRQWHLNLYGEGPDHKYIQDLIYYYDLEDRVTFYGYVREVESIWLSNHLMVLASRGEGTPLAILEAMMCGRPTVTTDVGGNREILEDEMTGFIAEAATPYSFGNALEYAWQKQESWKNMGHKAHHRAKQLVALEPARQVLKFVTDLQNFN